MKFLVAGGAESIGSEVFRHPFTAIDASVVHVDKPTYSGNLQAIARGERSHAVAWRNAGTHDSLIEGADSLASQGLLLGLHAQKSNLQGRNDPHLGIEWPVSKTQLSPKDVKLPTLAGIRARR